MSFSEWKEISISEAILSSNTGLDAIKRAPIVDYDSGIKCLRIQDISQNKNFENWGFCAVEDKNYNKFQLKKGDIIVARTGATTGINKLIKKDIKSVYNNGLIRIKVNSNIIDYRYLYYNMQGDNYKGHIQAISGGTSTQPNIKMNELLDCKIMLPSIQEQKAIADTLSCIDDKIEINNNIKKTLEEMVQAIFKSWFVDFEPFQDGEFEDSDLGMVPKGWSVKHIYDIAEIVSKGTTPTIKDMNMAIDESSINFIKVKDIDGDGLIQLKDIQKIPRSIHSNELKRSILKENDILFSIAGTIGRVSYVNGTIMDCNINQALAFIRLYDLNKHFNLLYYYLKSDFVQQDINSKIVQGVQANISLTVIKEMEIIVPDNNKLKCFNDIIGDIFKKIEKINYETNILNKLKYTLLPKLMSGEIRAQL